jgi:hypothetical protein
MPLTPLFSIQPFNQNKIMRSFNKTQYAEAAADANVQSVPRGDAVDRVFVSPKAANIQIRMPDLSTLRFSEIEPTRRRILNQLAEVADAGEQAPGEVGRYLEKLAALEQKLAPLLEKIRDAHRRATTRLRLEEDHTAATMLEKLRPLFGDRAPALVKETLAMRSINERLTTLPAADPMDRNADSLFKTLNKI